MSNYQTNLLIVGAGPFGLALAAQAAHLGIEHMVVGKPMDFCSRRAFSNFSAGSLHHEYARYAGFWTVLRVHGVSAGFSRIDL
jgi:2-polyprenyl-6-methoxyphenol hydroxylase-like FAD-dependent oxidoreductase